jgi:competence protein ComEC
MTLVWLGTAWLLGIYLGKFAPLPLPFLAAGAIALLGGAVVFRRNPRLAWMFLCAGTVGLGAARLTAARPILGANDIAVNNDGGPLAFRGVVDAYPDVRGSHTNLVLRVTEVRDSGDWRPESGRVLVRVNSYPPFDYGDRVEVWGKPETPPVFPDFSYKDYLARKGIYSLVHYARVRKLPGGGGHPLFAFLYAIRARAQGVIARILPEPQAGLLTGILLGLEAGIPRSLMGDFNATGTTHIIVISGFNITIIAGFLLALGRRTLGQRWATHATVTGIVLYTLLVGADAAVVRAAIMGVLYVAALHLGRRTEAFVSLFFAAFVMTLLNPWTLWDMGFQLSFLATLSLIRFTPALQVRFEGVLSRLWRGSVPPQVLALLNDALIVTLAAQIMTTPLIVSAFGRLSLVSLLTNFLILPVQPAVMISGAVATIGGLLALPLGRALAWFPWLTLTYTIRVVEWTARIPHASIDVGRFSAAWLLPYYGLLLGLPLARDRWPALIRSRFAPVSQLLHSPKVILSALALGALLSWSAAVNTSDGRLHLNVFDVGEGNAVFIVTPTGGQVLVDGGPDPSRLLPRLGRAMPFWDRTVEWVIVTRWSAGHLAGLVPVLHRYSVGGVVMPASGGSGSAYQALRSAIEERHVPVVTARAGERIDLGRGASLEVLSVAGENDGAVSVLRVRWNRACFLLSEALDEAAESEVLRRYEALPCTVLVAGRNGSRHASSERFLEAVHPSLVIIPVGANNRFGHPAPEVLQRVDRIGARLLRTDLAGSVEITTDGQQYWLDTER